MMRNFLVTALFLVSTLITPQAMAYEVEEPSAGEMIVDLVFVRPMMAGTTAVGAGLYVLTFPFSLLGGNAGEAAEKLILEPGYETVGRCLGCN